MESHTPPIFQVWEYLKNLHTELDVRIEFSHVKDVQGKSKSDELTLQEFQEISRMYDLTAILITLYMSNSIFVIHSSVDNTYVSIEPTNTGYTMIYSLDGLEISDVAEFMNIAKDIQQIYQNHNEE